MILTNFSKRIWYCTIYMQISIEISKLIDNAAGVKTGKIYMSFQTHYVSLLFY